MKHCVIFGHPISHSKSPDIYHQFARENNIALTYHLAEPALNGLRKELEIWLAKGILGGNVTVPFKEEMLKYCDELTIEAKTAQAVNTIHVKDGRLIGHNTDGLGLMVDIEEKKDYSIEGKKVLLLGAGGASRGIIKPLFDRKPEKVTISNRTHARAEQLVKEFASYGAIEAVERHKLEETYDLIINATSATLQGVFPPLPAGIIGQQTVGYDLMYADESTIFMDYILTEGGALAFDGLGMLIEQAVLAFHFWFSITPKTDEVTELLRPTS